MKKYLLRIGTTLSLLAPIIAIISCDNVTTTKTNPGTTDPGTTNPGTTNPGTTNPGTTNPGTTNPGTTNPGGGNRDKKTIFKNGRYTVYESNSILSEKYGLKNYRYPNITNLEPTNKTEYKTRLATGEIFAPHFRPADIPTWKPKNETDGDYVKSRVPIANREFVLEQITKTKGEGRYFAMDTLRNGTSNSLNKTSTKGDANSQIIQGLQYMTDIVVFGGSSGEGEVYIPRAQDIDAYHRMGIKVHACIYFAPEAYSGSESDYTDLMGDNFEKAANQLVKMAKYYGFDGWFINDENGPQPKWIDFMKVFHKKAKDANIEISYYKNGNYGDIYDVGHEVYDLWFNDYGAGQGEALGVKENESPRGFQTTDSSTTIAGQRQDPFDHSIIKYGARGATFWTYKEWENGTYYKNEEFVQKFLNGWDLTLEKPISDPRKAPLNGMAHWYKEYTPFVKHSSFSTSFNKGEGDFFNVDGTAIQSKFFDAGYSNMSLQDYLPTWKYIIDVAGLNGVVDESKIGKSGISVDHKETKDAWFGSDALVYKGIIEKNKMITNKLFASNIKLEEKDNFSIMYKGDVIPSLAVWTKEGNNFKTNILDGKSDDATFSNKYHRVVYDLSSLKGKQMTSFGIAIKNKGIKKLKVNNFVLGKMSFNAIGENPSNKLKIKNMVNGGEWLLAKGKNIRLKWETNNKTIKGYFIYKDNEKFNDKELIGMTNTPSILLRGLDMKTLSHVSIIPFDKNNNLFSKIKVNINGNMLDFSDDSKWTHKVFLTNYYGYETGHKFVGKALDGEGGMYLVNDQVQLIHINKYGVIQQGGDYKKIIFPDNLDSKEHEKAKKTTFSTLFIGQNKKIFIGRRYNGNGLYIFNKGLKEVSKEWSKFKNNNSIFAGLDNNDEMEYVAKIIQQEDGSFILISSLGNLKKISKDGILDETFNKTFDEGNMKEISKISTIKLGKKIIINYHFVDNNINVFEKIIDENGNISNSTMDSKLGYILDSKETKDTIVISTLCLVDNRFETFVKIYDKEKARIIKSAKVNIVVDGASDSNSLVYPKNDYYNAFTLSSDGKNLIFRDTKNHSSIGSNNQDFVKNNSYIIVVSIREILKAIGNPIHVKSIYVKRSVGGNRGGGDFRVMTAINGLIYYGTSDYGRVGAIKVDYDKLENTSLVKIKSIIYKFTKPNGRKLTVITIESLKTNSFSKNPNKMIDS